MERGSRNAAPHVETKKPQMSQPILDIVPKKPQVPHVAHQMQPAAVQKHRAQKSPHEVRGAIRHVSFSTGHKSRYDTVVTDKWLKQRTQAEFVRKGRQVGKDYAYRNHGRRSRGVAVTERYHVALLDSVFLKMGATTGKAAPFTTPQNSQRTQFNIVTRRFRQNLSRDRGCTTKRRRERLSGAGGARIFSRDYSANKGKGIADHV